MVHRQRFSMYTRFAPPPPPGACFVQGCPIQFGRPSSSALAVAMDGERDSLGVLPPLDADGSGVYERPIDMSKCRYGWWLPRCATTAGTSLGFCACRDLRRRVHADGVRVCGASTSGGVHRRLLLPVCGASTSDEYVAPVPAGSAAPAPVEEYIAPAPAGSAAPAPVEEYIAPCSCPVCGASTSGRVHRACSCLVCGASTSGSVHRARSCRVRGTCACGGVFFTRASSVPVASARCGVSFTPKRQRQVSISHLRQLCFVLEVFKALSQDRVPPLVVDMIFLSLLGGVALRMRLAVCTFGMCTRARHDGRLQCRRTRMRMRGRGGRGGGRGG